ncbi:MAG TPA: hypothetical protein H9900_00510 [Candidatus Monoglobus merdigallinarum]|uniref:Beta-lactamase n=1 Tax=Candidatus Monoglobus merdigallinarum TaxID=2838698 RepID=A0A9D1TKZ5_9FIRM|nr:hypothetical protein [Candidatus Monoglobus merdigallinarum]
MKLKDTTKRAFIISAIIGVLAIACIIRLFELQIVNGDSYRERADSNSVRTYTIKAPRGEIFDRNGEPIVENRAGFSIQLFDNDISAEELNRNLNDIIKLLRSNDSSYDSTFPIVYDYENKLPAYDFKKNESGAHSGGESDDSALIAEWESANGVDGFGTLREIVGYFCDRYEVSGEYSDEEKIDIIAVRYEMEQRSFNKANPFVMATDVSDVVVQKIKEKYSHDGFADIVVDTIRNYSHGSTAAHILGRTGIIYAEEYETLKDQGYGMNDIIGKDGLEEVLEPYLRGRDGYRKVRMTDDGRYDEEVELNRPKAGNYAELTIDLRLQKAMEESLAKNIGEAVGEGGSGAAIAVDPKSGEVLAIASYPSYDPETFNENYDELINSESKPLFNRCLNGTYAPGSTFKILTAVAGLESGTIDTDTYITDRGRYTYYSDYQPTCLVYSSSGATHGTIEVSEAIGVSCNYFFFDIGRRMGIEVMDEYCEKFGLGQETGLELSESRGVVASPEEREASGGEWQPGDVLQSAIGQSDNLFTPAQIAGYISTVLNRGTRYRLHLVKRVGDYDTGETVMENSAEVLSENEISSETLEAVKDGMRQVVRYGTASSVFSDCEYGVGGKTGTAEVSDGADNVLFTGFAPYDDPEIVVAAVVEHGASSSYAAKIGREIFDEYMKINGVIDNEDQD